MERREAIADFLRGLLDTFRARLRASFMLRWVLANVAGWSVGLYLSAWSLATPALCLGGAFAGLCVGAAQWWALKASPAPLLLTPSQIRRENAAGISPIVVERNWIGLTIAGAILGGLPAFGMSLVVALGWGIGTALVGAIFGGGVGVAQYFILGRGLNRAEWWIAANVAGGALCALFTLAPFIRGLPIGLLLGTAAYGYITGRALVWLQQQTSG